MNTVKKAVIIVVVGFVLQVIISCACHCADSHHCKYTYDSFTTKNIDGSGPHAIFSTTDTIPKNAFGVELSVVIKQSGICQLKSNSLFTEAKAGCNCPPPVLFNAQDTLLSITVTTVGDFDPQHPADTDVSDYFQVLVQTALFSIANFITLPPETFTAIEGNVNIDLYLKTPPPNAGDYSFKINLLFSGGRNLEYTTKSAHLF